MAIKLDNISEIHDLRMTYWADSGISLEKMKGRLERQAVQCDIPLKTELTFVSTGMFQKEKAIELSHQKDRRFQKFVIRLTKSAMPKCLDVRVYSNGAGLTGRKAGQEYISRTRKAAAHDLMHGNTAAGLGGAFGAMIGGAMNGKKVKAKDMENEENWIDSLIMLYGSVFY